MAQARGLTTEQIIGRVTSANLFLGSTLDDLLDAAGAPEDSGYIKAPCGCVPVWSQGVGALRCSAHRWMNLGEECGPTDWAKY